MELHRALPPLVLLLASCGGGGSGTDGGVPPPGALTVTGTITATAAATSRLDFPSRTALVDDAGTLADGDLGGHCLIVRSTDGGPDRVDVAVEQIGSMLDAGIHQLQVRLDDPRPGSTTGVITASLGPPDPSGGGTYVVSPGPSCAVTTAYDATARTASITLPASCTLVGIGGMVTTAGTLSFAGCTVE